MEENLELYHHGILGQKWGVRRYQNKDGSLTTAGKKKYGTKSNFERVQAAKKAASKDVIKAKKQRAKAEERTNAEILKYKKKAGLIGKEDAKSEKTKSVKEMSDEELRAKINRIRLEQEFNNLSPKKLSTGEKLVKSVTKFAVDKGGKALSDYAEKEIRKALGLEKKNGDKDALDDLKKKAQELNLRKQIDIAEQYLGEGKYRNKKNDKESASKESTSKESTSKESTSKESTSKESTSKVEYEYKEPKSANKTSNSEYVKDIIDADPSWFREVHSEDVSSGRSYVDRYLLEDKKQNER